ncbi:MAG: hypothetical protein QOH93_3446 [Chloroflexia bacterium]|nr:hypothetical protein [Chloroflexia bacterium]
MSKKPGRNLRYSVLALLLTSVMAIGLGLGTSSSASVIASSHVAPRDAAARATLDGQLVDKMQTTNGPMTVMIELSGQPATVAASAISGAGKGTFGPTAIQAGKQQHANNDKAQQDVLRALTSAGASVQVLYRVQNAYNGIAVIAGKQDIEKMRQVAGVKAVHLMVPHTIDNASSVPLIGAPFVWENYGYTGQGISIGVIDTGIDYIHTNFGGSGSSTDYLIYTDTTPSAVTAAAGVYPNEKVVGGYDFAGDTYNADPTDPNYQPIPTPDDNPLDCNGHGSHVSGTAAGYGVNSNGSTYTGAYDTTSVPTNTMRIGPGVAPEAELYALRIFGCEGSTNLTELAIDWATDPNGDSDFSDHLDVINMSLGSSYGTPDDSSAAASDNAALIGVQVVTSAGNSSDVYYVSGSPGSATWALSTASSSDEVDITDGFRVNPPSEISGTYPASESANYNWAASSPVTSTIYYPANNKSGCSAWTGADATNITNTHPIVIVDWRSGTSTTFPCGSATRSNNATAAGAKGIIMVDNTTYLDTSIAGNTSIPAMYTVKQVGDTLKSVLTAGAVQTETVTLSHEYHNTVRLVSPGRNNTLSSFSSRGPRTIDNALKPDITAPGQGIFSTANGTGNQGETLSGTSMASPHMAGTMALLRQEHPDWTVEELKALAMNTANVDIWTGFNGTGTRYAPARVGAGRVNVPFAAASDVVAYNAETAGAVSVSFGFVNVLGTSTLTKTVEIANKGTEPIVYQLGYVARTTVPGVSYSFPDGNVVSVPAGGTATFRVQLDAVAANMRNAIDPTVAQVQSGLTRNWLNEASGLITLSPTGRPDISGQVLRVPLYATLRPASNMTTTENQLVVNGDTTTSLHLTGQGVNTGASYPNDFTSLVSAFELAATSGPEDLNALEVTETTRHADLQYVGITSDAPARAAITDTEIFLGISTYGSWTTPASEMQVSIFFDTDQDGTDDYEVFNTRLTDTDVAVTALDDLNSSGPLALEDVINYYLANLPPTAEMNNSVMAMPVYAADLGLGVGDTTFNYHVVTYDRFQGAGAIDQTGTLTYDIANPGLDFTGGLTGIPMYNDLPGNTIPVTYNAANYAANGDLGVLLLHHYNLAGNRAQVIPVGAENTATATTTATTPFVCNIEFTDVPPGSTFYSYIHCLACKGVISGYGDHTFRPANNITRGQIAKIVANAAGFNEAVEGQTYADVIPSDDPSSFYVYIERLSNRNVMSGYPCGGAGETCDGQNRAFFRPGNNATRGQLAKIVSNAAGFTENVSGQTFADVPPSMDPSSFYVFVERLASRGVMGGYPCGSRPDELCDGQNRPYFRPGALVTRGQASKIVANTFFPDCNPNVVGGQATATAAVATQMPTGTVPVPGPTNTVVARP